MGRTARRPRGQSQLRALQRYGLRDVPELSPTTMAPTATTLPLSLSSICCVYLLVFLFFIAGFSLVEWHGGDTELPRFFYSIVYLRKNVGESSW